MKATHDQNENSESKKPIPTEKATAKKATKKKSALDKIKEKCEFQTLQVKPFVKEIPMYDSDTEEIYTRKVNALLVSIPEEREAKNLIIVENKFTEQILQTNFEKFKFIKGYEAIWSSELKIVECEVEAEQNVFMGPNSRAARLGKYFQNVGNEDEDETSFVFPSPSPDIKIFIGDGSLEFAVLSSLQRENFSALSGTLRRKFTIRIEGRDIKTHDEAKEFLEALSNSVLFQIDLAVDVPLHLTMDREIIRGIKKRKRLGKDLNFSTPKYQYDKEAMTLYWYGRSSTNMPLLQFLAFYQVLEFYFPLYSLTEAQHRIKNLLKDPFFNSDKDTDIAQIINIIKVSAKGKAIGDERSQLKATIQHIIDSDSLMAFYEEDEERKNYFDQSRSQSKGIAKQRINFFAKENDLRIETALRVYEIRCRIVHSKEEDEFALLLPFSPEIKNIKYDLDLVEFLARKAIIAGGRPLSL